MNRYFRTRQAPPQQQRCPVRQCLHWLQWHRRRLLRIRLEFGRQRLQPCRHWRILAIGTGLTISLGVMGLMSLVAMLYGSRAGIAINRYLGVHAPPVSWHIMQWAGDIAPRNR